MSVRFPSVSTPKRPVDWAALAKIDPNVHVPVLGCFGPSRNRNHVRPQDSPSNVFNPGWSCYSLYFSLVSLIIKKLSPSKTAIQVSITSLTHGLDQDVFQLGKRTSAGISRPRLFTPTTTTGDEFLSSKFFSAVRTPSTNFQESTRPTFARLRLTRSTAALFLWDVRAKDTGVHYTWPTSMEIIGAKWYSTISDSQLWHSSRFWKEAHPSVFHITLSCAKFKWSGCFWRRRTAQKSVTSCVSHILISTGLLINDSIPTISRLGLIFSTVEVSSVLESQNDVASIDEIIFHLRSTRGMQKSIGVFAWLRGYNGWDSFGCVLFSWSFMLWHNLSQDLGGTLLLYAEKSWKFYAWLFDSIAEDDGRILENFIEQWTTCDTNDSDPSVSPCLISLGHDSNRLRHRTSSLSKSDLQTLPLGRE